MLGLYVGNMDRIGTIGEFVCDREVELLLLTGAGEAENVDTGAAGGDGDRAELLA